jgi:hypothetical protein
LRTSPIFCPYRAGQNFVTAPKLVLVRFDAISLAAEGGAMSRFTFVGRFTFLFAAVFVISVGTAISYLISPP